MLTSTWSMVVFFSIGMEEAVSIAPNKRRKVETDCQLCIICQVNTHDEPLVENPQVQSIETVLFVN